MKDRFLITMIKPYKEYYIMKNNRNNLTLFKRKLDSYFCNCNNTVYIENCKIIFIVDDKRGNKFKLQKLIYENFEMKDIIDEINRQMIVAYFGEE